METLTLVSSCISEMLFPSFVTQYVLLVFRCVVPLHGHVFQVVGRDDGYYDPVLNASIPLNLPDPMRRDTIRVTGRLLLYSFCPSSRLSCSEP